MEYISEVYFRAWKKVSGEFLEVMLYLKFHLGSFEFQGGEGAWLGKVPKQALGNYFPKERASLALSRYKSVSYFECLSTVISLVAFKCL